VSITVLVFLVLYIFAYFIRLKTVMHSVYLSSFIGALPLDPAGGFRPQAPCFVPPWKFVVTPLYCVMFCCLENYVIVA